MDAKNGRHRCRFSACRMGNAPKNANFRSNINPQDLSLETKTGGELVPQERVLVTSGINCRHHVKATWRFELNCHADSTSNRDATDRGSTERTPVRVTLGLMNRSKGRLSGALGVQVVRQTCEADV